MLSLLMRSGRHLSCGLVLGLALGACVGGGGGGGGGGGPSIGTGTPAGGLPGAECSAVLAHGCATENGVDIRVVCDAATKKWTKVAVCGLGEICASVPNSQPVQTQCTAANPGGTDAATANDTASGSDAILTDTAQSDAIKADSLVADVAPADTAGTDSGGVDAPLADSPMGDSATGPVCGDGKCEAGEFNATCPADCKTACKPTCEGKQCGPDACGGVCGVCGETKACTDAGKCVGVATVCGNGECEPGETATTCAKDCKATCAPSCAGKDCGDIDGCGGLCAGACPGGGTYTADKNCQGGSLCGNGTCDAGENNSSCPKDCKADCLPQCAGKTCGPNGCGGICGMCGGGKACTDEGTCVALGPVCGNGMCEAGETAENCGQDCKTTGPVCGNGFCEVGETTESCSKDCKPTTPVCGNGMCEAGETTANCLKDCPASGGDSSCVGKCGSKATTCYCDDACTKAGDCCTDYKAVCGGTTCTPKCTATTVCGTADGCNGTCPGTCTAGLVCNSQKVCVPNTAKCGNGVCEAGENTTSCPADCKTAAGSCSGLCGKASSGCYCDTQCKSSNDCCADYDKFCGSTSTACPNGKCEAGETEASCPADCKMCAGNFSLGSTFFKSNDTKQIGLACNPSGAPKNCPDGHWFTFVDTGECICIVSCAALSVTLGQNCTTDGAWKCSDIKATNASANGGQFCVPTKWGLCTK